jgi:hypothetical protein
VFLLELAWSPQLAGIDILISGTRYLILGTLLSTKYRGLALSTKELALLYKYNLRAPLILTSMPSFMSALITLLQSP